ncbi:MAG: hypothetical protein DSY50_02030 [Desulfobulbus sp.]|nr:MAG: hypothetical protein DSY50_02030 [Desulfobulbus sp.]RUM41573.1 MAG: hypothetical protein DSY70_01105 [Desulfobulbus sp.]
MAMQLYLSATEHLPIKKHCLCHHVATKVIKYKQPFSSALDSFFRYSKIQDFFVQEVMTLQIDSTMTIQQVAMYII